MTFALSRYETWELDALLLEVERPEPWLLRTFFGAVKMFTTKTIEFDVVNRGRRMAPFVSPMVAGKPMSREGSQTRALTPAYIKPLDLVTPPDAFTRRPGEGYGGTMSPQARFDSIVAETLALHQDAINVRLEWMAAQALVTGGITISGEEYPSTHVSFLRDPSLSIVLTGTARWSQTTSNPMGNVENAALNVRAISRGAVISDLVMDGLTWGYLRQHAEIQDLINVFNRNYLPGQQPTSIDKSPRTKLNEAVYVGTLNGNIDLWVYDSFYEDDNGDQQPYIPPNTVVGLSRSALEGRQYYGAIIDLDAQMEARRSFTKSKVKFNPSGLELLTQSAPLVAPRRPNASFVMTVN